MSEDVRFLQLLQKERERRLGARKDAEEVKAHPFFSNIDWSKLESRELQPPFNPQVVSPLLPPVVRVVARLWLVAGRRHGPEAFRSGVRQGAGACFGRSQCGLRRRLFLSRRLRRLLLRSHASRRLLLRIIWIRLILPKT